MLINISELILKNQKELLINDKIKLNIDHLKITTPISLDGKIIINNETLFVELIISFDIIMKCSRCLKNFTTSMNIPIKDKISIVDNIGKTKDTIDLTDLIKENIIVNIPMKSLCNTSCKGICHICGIDKNNAHCECDNDQIDPRMSILDSFFSDGDE